MRNPCAPRTWQRIWKTFYHSSTHVKKLKYSLWTFLPPRLSRVTGSAAVAPNRCHPTRRPGCSTSSGDPDPTRLDDPPSAAAGLVALREDRATKPPPGESRSRALYKAQAAAQMANAITTPAPFRERLVWFWTNHFVISLKRRQCAAVAAAFVEEAIRPHVTGRFGDMVLAVMRHPAMLLYLDNANSFGPDSIDRSTHPSRPE